MSVSSAGISEIDRMKVRKKFTIPKNERMCFTASCVLASQLQPYTQLVPILVLRF